MIKTEISSRNRTPFLPIQWRFNSWARFACGLGGMDSILVSEVHESVQQELRSLRDTVELTPVSFLYYV
jgi:hypothetical protein